MSRQQSPACDKHTTDAQPLAIEILVKPARHGIKKKKSDIRTKSAFVCQTLCDDALFFDDQRHELEGAAVDEAAVGEAEVRQAGERDEGHGHEWGWHVAADGFPGFFELGDVGGHVFGGFVVHETGDRQFCEAEHLAVLNGDHAAAALDEGVGGEGHVVIIGADDEEVVGVVGDGGGHSAALDAEAFDEACAFGAGGVVAFEDDGLEHVLCGVAFKMAVCHSRDISSPCQTKCSNG